MKSSTWNKLYLRCRLAMVGKSPREKGRIKRAWLATMQRRTKTICFFQPW